jgi:hypothetical protein
MKVFIDSNVLGRIVWQIEKKNKESLWYFYIQTEKPSEEIRNPAKNNIVYVWVWLENYGVVLKSEDLEKLLFASNVFIRLWTISKCRIGKSKQFVLQKIIKI